MCGINGIWLHQTNDSNLNSAISAMNTCLKHRGPDGDGVFTNDHTALGHKRLAIIDTSSEGNQPLHSFDKRYTIVYNGELYNYQSLKANIEYPFQTKTDTEVILAYYSKYGKNCLSYLDGMFAFAIYDHAENQLFIARDRMGIKPLYYFSSNQYFIFSSEIRALLSSNKIPKKLNPASLSSYLRNQTVYAPHTILQDVFMLLPGHYIEIKKGEVRTVQYYNLRENYLKEASSLKRDENEIKNTIRDLFFNSIKKRLVSDVPFGAFLSGGIDSSAVVAVMSKFSNSPVNTFSVVFEDEAFNEAPYSQLISKLYKTNHTEIKLSPNALLDVLPAALKAMDHPTVDGINTYLVSKVTREKGIKMALSGIGGDELFAGYELFKRIYAWNNHLPKLQKTPSFIKSIVAKGIGLKNNIQTEKLADLLYQKSPNLYSLHETLRSLYSQKQIAGILKQKNAFSPHSTNAIYPDYILSEISLIETETYLQNVLLRDTDQMSMAVALEVREPFLDYLLIEYVLGIPDSIKYPSSPKKLFVDAMGDLIPSEIVHRPKMGFTFPWKTWLKEDLKAMVEGRLLSLSKRSYFQKNAILALWQRFLKNDPSITWSRIWALVALECWLQENGVE